MSVFICSKCGMMENTATSHYWIRPKDSPPLCVLCDPAIGKWHNCFDRKPIPPDCVVGPDGFIYHKDDSYLKKQLKEKKEP